MCKSILTVIILIFTAKAGFPQLYKSWFVSQYSIACPEKAVGFSLHSYYNDSAAVKNAFLNGCENFVRNSKESIYGSQTFWSTENGTYTMGREINEQYDTSLVSAAALRLKITDTLITENFVAVLVTSCGPDFISKECPVVEMKDVKRPEWIDSLPKEPGYNYALGSSPLYFYEMSSWKEAEWAARKAFALSVCSKTMSVEKLQDRSGQQVRNEEVAVTLSGVEVVARWKNSRENICYVLCKMRE